MSIRKDSNVLINELDKLANLVNLINFDEELPVNQIVEVYYQITNVSSMITVMKQQLDQTNDRASKEAILNAEKFIFEQFNSVIHPNIMQIIDHSISVITDNLQSLPVTITKDTIENEAKLYEKLREIMSTEEFVKQYDANISHD